MIAGLIVKLVRVLNSNQKIGEVAGGVAFGFLLACIPSMNLLWFVLLLIAFLVKVNFAAVLVFLALFKLVVPLADPALHLLGAAVLTFNPLEGFFTLLYNLAVVPFTRFNNTLVMGGLLTGIFLWIPLFLLFKQLVSLYRSKIRDRIKNSKFAKWFAKLPLISGLIRIFAKAGSIRSSLG
jgi:uncharacterized protein (TIGR03546 family)